MLKPFKNKKMSPGLFIFYFFSKVLSSSLLYQASMSHEGVSKPELAASSAILILVSSISLSMSLWISRRKSFMA